jgi:hypothetical protein
MMILEKKLKSEKDQAAGEMPPDLFEEVNFSG